jgi:peptidoglycan/LPS O-acetylase OafA/YrhL
VSRAWVAALRRGAIPIALGLVCWVLATWALDDLHPLLVWLGILLVALGAVIVVANGRTLSAEERRLGTSLAGRPAKLPLDGRD